MAMNKRTASDAPRGESLPNMTTIPGTDTARAPLPDVTRFSNGADSMKSGVTGHTIGRAPGSARVPISDADVRAYDNGAGGNTRC